MHVLLKKFLIFQDFSQIKNVNNNENMVIVHVHTVKLDIKLKNFTKCMGRGLKSQSLQRIHYTDITLFNLSKIFSILKSDNFIMKKKK